MYVKLEKEKGSILSRIDAIIDDKERNKSLSEDFIFGYYAENEEIYKKKEETCNQASVL